MATTMAALAAKNVHWRHFMTSSTASKFTKKMYHLVTRIVDPLTELSACPKRNQQAEKAYQIIDVLTNGLDFWLGP